MGLNQGIWGYTIIGFSVVLIIVLSLIKSNYDEQSAFVCDIVSKDPAFDMTKCPVHQSKTSWYITLSFGFAALILAMGIYFSFFSKIPLPEPKKEYANIDASKLDEEEKSICDKLKENNGSMYQSDLIKQTGYTKVKMTRLLDKLESKGILERKRRGMTNIAVLK
ncbi:MarR family transcriptional regulator [Candidatus Woesearchaeota archaeon]|nr:MarR family transcriptional regulator [Candidatus Woesearchaeota archaeon]MBI2660829.1 MarR family transcriptional regulator [Candidatus Woesearchaeota archaeon]